MEVETQNMEEVYPGKECRGEVITSFVDSIQNIGSPMVSVEDVFSVMSVCFAWAGVFSESIYPLVALLSLAISLSLLALYEVWAFKARKALQQVALVEHQQVYKMNVIYTFLFTLYYINYCINDLPKQLEKQKLT